MTISISTPKRFTTQQGFELLIRTRENEVYRRHRDRAAWLKQAEFLVREGKLWYAKTGTSGINPRWCSPGLATAEAAFAFAEVEGWGPEP